MTVKELYEWSVEYGVEDYEIEIQYCNSGDCYYGTDSLDEWYIDIEEDKKVVVLKL